MKLLILSLFLVAASNLYSQDVISLPVRQGAIVPIIGAGKFNGVFITSNNDSCFASKDGVVTSTFRLSNDEQALIIKQAPETYVTYSNLYLTSVSRGDVIKKGAFIGLLKKNDKDFKLRFMVTNGTGKFISQNDHLNYLSQNSSL